ncbi:hypothetical protein GWI33_016789 [Rhynchophorus ferrugineus]|uniref:Uncharacterized protein n=1 Tax=Rhynchophorus ferrugineus TaxID=354439 RepID=A0A834M9Y7_RHYFE|nr:hypothetical protein GWI33_016789 [Rhynchophorus ferrugineus]
MSKRKTQKILVPKGTINPNEDVLIEIPIELRDQPMVIAKRPDKNRSYRKLTMPDNEDDLTRRKPKKKHKRLDDSNEDISLYHKASNSSALNKTGVDNLDETEQLEKDLIQSKLQNFQQARRMFILETTSVATNASAISPDINTSSDLDFESDFKKKKLLSSSVLTPSCGKQSDPSGEGCGGRMICKNPNDLDSEDSDSSETGSKRSRNMPQENENKSDGENSTYIINGTLANSRSGNSLKKHTKRKEKNEGRCGREENNNSEIDETLYEENRILDKTPGRSRKDDFCLGKVNKPKEEPLDDGSGRYKKIISVLDKLLDTVNKDDSSCTSLVNSKRRKKEVDVCGQNTVTPKRLIARLLNFDDTPPCATPVNSRMTKEKKAGSCGQKMESAKHKKAKHSDDNVDSPCTTPTKRKRSKEKEMGVCKQEFESPKHRKAKDLSRNINTPCTTPVKSKRSEEKGIGSCERAIESPKHRTAKYSKDNVHSPCDNLVKTQRSKEKDVGGCEQKYKSPKQKIHKVPDDDGPGTYKRSKDKGDDHRPSSLRKDIDKNVGLDEILAYGPRKRTKAVQWPDDDDDDDNMRKKSEEKKMSGCKPNLSGSILSNKIREWSYDDDSASSSSYNYSKDEWSKHLEKSYLNKAPQCAVKSSPDSYSSITYPPLPEIKSEFQPISTSSSFNLTLSQPKAHHGISGFTPSYSRKCNNIPQSVEISCRNKTFIFPENYHNYPKKCERPKDASDYDLLSNSATLPEKNVDPSGNFPKKCGRPKEANDYASRNKAFIYSENYDYSRNNKKRLEANADSLLNQAIRLPDENDTYKCANTKPKETHDYILLNKGCIFPEDAEYIGSSQRYSSKNIRTKEIVNSTWEKETDGSLVKENLFGPDNLDDEDVFHIQDLVSSFQDARTKLNNAVKLASSTLKQLNATKNYSEHRLDESDSNEKQVCQNKLCVQESPDQQIRKKTPSKHQQHDDTLLTSSCHTASIGPASKEIANKNSKELQEPLTNMMNRSLDNLISSKVKDDRKSPYKAKSSRSLNLSHG